MLFVSFILDASKQHAFRVFSGTPITEKRRNLRNLTQSYDKSQFVNKRSQKQCGNAKIKKKTAAIQRLWLTRLLT